MHWLPENRVRMKGHLKILGVVLIALCSSTALHYAEWAQNEARATKIIMAERSREAARSVPKEAPEVIEDTRPLGVLLDAYGVGADLKNAAPLLGLDLNAMATFEAEKGGPYLKFFRLRGENLSLSGKGLCFTGKKGVLITYSSGLKKTPPELKGADAIDPEDARQTAQAVVDALGIDVDFCGLEVGPNIRNHSPGWDDYLHNSYYQVGTDLGYMDYETGSLVSVQVSSKTGEVLAVMHEPLVIPDMLEVRLTADDAIACVGKFLKRDEAQMESLKKTLEVEEKKRIIAPNQGAWHGPPYTGPDHDVGRVAYRVLAGIHVLNVDAITGEIIGGMRGHPPHNHRR